MGQLPLERRDGDFFYSGTEFADRIGVFQGQLLAQFFIFGVASIFGPLFEARNEGSVNSFGGDFILDGLAKSLDQADDQNDQRDPNHHAKDGEKAPQLVRADRVESEF